MYHRTQVHYPTKDSGTYQKRDYEKEFNYLRLEIKMNKRKMYKRVRIRNFVETVKQNLYKIPHRLLNIKNNNQ